MSNAAQLLELRQHLGMEEGLLARAAEKPSATPEIAEDAPVEMKLYVLARECMDAKGNVADAADEFQRRLDEFPDLQQQWVEQALDAAAKDLVRQATKDTRNAVGRNVATGRSDQSDPRERAGGGMAAILRNRGIFDWPLPGGAPLGKATLTDVAEAQEHYQKIAQTNSARAAFFAAIAEGLRKKPARTVADRFTAQELERMFRETGNA